MMEHKKYLMLRDTPSKRGALLYSGGVFSLDKIFGDTLVDAGKARAYDDKADAKRMVNLDGRQMTWGEYLKYCRRRK